MVSTKKQRELLNLWAEGSLKRINILSGSVRSGKTWISLMLWAFFVADSPKDMNYLMVAKSLNTLKRNCLNLLQDFVGEENFSYSIHKKEGTLFGRRILLEGAYNDHAESRIRGLTLNGAYCDELSLISEDFFKMLLTRLSTDGALLIATTNPDSPSHWLMKNYIARKDELDLLFQQFMLEDNDFLSKKYIESLKKEFSGVFYDRFILGKWVAAEGLIYREFVDNKSDYLIDCVLDKLTGETCFKKGEKCIPIDFCQIGIDFGGNKSAHSFVLTGIAKGFKSIVIMDEMYIKADLNPDELNTAFENFINRNKKHRIFAVYADSAEPVLINGLNLHARKKNLVVDIRKAKKGSINNRIRFYKMLFSNKAIYISKDCIHLIKALEEATWDSSLGADKRLDDYSTNVDSLDAMEYATESVMDVVMKVVVG